MACLTMGELSADNDHNINTYASDPDDKAVETNPKLLPRI